MDNIWDHKEYNEAAVSQIQEQLGISWFTACLLVQRGIETVQEARYFLYAGLDTLTDPWQMQGMKEAVERIQEAAKLKQKVIIYGDYDVDGVCSIVIMLECLSQLGCGVDYYVPNRFQEGYGLNKAAVKDLVRQGYQLLITVDCGINSVEETELAIGLGMDVIITDHHTPGQVQPPARAIINPKNDGLKSIADLAGAGVAFKLATALWQDVFPQEKIYEWLDLVALATVADIVPLQNENRILVKYGLPALERSSRIGIKALLQTTGLAGKHIQSWQIGFVLGPHLNSAGRMESARASIDLLLSQDEREALVQAAMLGKMNDERRQVEESIYREAVAHIEKEAHWQAEPVLVVDGDGWHQGVIGIVASRLVALYNRPTIIISWAADMGKASARSIGEFDLFAALNGVSNCLLGFGGHKLAAGLSISRDKLNDFKTQLKEYAHELPIQWETKKHFRVDMEIEEEDINEELMAEIESLAPFGEGNPVPHFVLRGSAIKDPVLIGNNRAHLKFKTGRNNLEGIAFNRGEDKLSSWRCCHQDLLFELDRNDYGGRKRLQLKIKDLKATFIPDRKKVGPSNYLHLTGCVRKAVQELTEQRPVLFVYPTYRSLKKHQAVMELLLNKDMVQTLHGHLSRGERIKGQNRLEQGVGRVFLITRALLNYHADHYGLPSNLRYMVYMWPVAGTKPEGAGSQVMEVAIIKPPAHLVFHSNPELAASQDKKLIYANLPRTVKQYNLRYAGATIESGLKNMQARRLARRKYRALQTGILLIDGTHTAGWNQVGGINELILADSPLGLYELTAVTDYLLDDQELSLGIAFNQGSLDYNRRYLEQLYPGNQIIKDIMGYLGRYEKAEGIRLQDMLVNLNRQTNYSYNHLEICSVLHIMADLGLCRLQKSGTIMPITIISTKRRDAEELLKNSENIPYRLEGVAERKALDEWEKILNKELEW